MISSLVLVLVLPMVACLILLAPTLLRLFKGSRIDEISPEWLEKFSPRSYHPMEGLLNGADFAFLSSQPGFDLSLYRKLRKDRLQIFRQYLDRMIVDFNRLHLTARLAVAQAPEDHSDLLSRLITIKLRFSASVLVAEIRYALCRFGLCSLSVRGLILQLEELSAQVAAASSGQPV